MPGTVLRLMCLTAALGVVPHAFAQDADPMRMRVTQILGVLKDQPNEASAACLDSLKEMHNTEDALQVATNRQKSSDIELANDVLETDYQNVIQLCGVDATRVCNSQHSATLGKSCAVIRPHE